MAATAARGPASGQTQMHTPAQGQTTQTQTQAVLHLRGAARESEVVQGGETRRRIQWAEDVVDNEGMGKKKSKVCCIYHAPREFGESSDESSSDSSDSDSDSGDDGAARPARKNGPGHNHNHDHGKGNGKGKGKPRARSPNAYEKMPKPKSGVPKGGNS